MSSRSVLRARYRTVAMGGLALVALGLAGFVLPLATDLLGQAFQADVRRELMRSADLARWAGMRAGVSGRAVSRVSEGEPVDVTAAWQVTETRATRPSGGGPRRRELGSGAGLFRIVIPEIGLDAVVVDGVEPEHLRKGPGLYPGSAWPGEPGNCRIAGHRVTFGHPFRRLDELGVGSAVQLVVGSENYTYRVTSKRTVPRGDRSPLSEAVTPTLTLTTCHPPHRATERLVVRAELADAS